MARKRTTKTKEEPEEVVEDLEDLEDLEALADSEEDLEVEDVEEEDDEEEEAPRRRRKPRAKKTTRRKKAAQEGIGSADLAEALGTTGRELRVMLRDHQVEKNESGRYEWESVDDALDELGFDSLEDAQEALADSRNARLEALKERVGADRKKKRKTKAAAEEDEDDEDLEEDEEEEEEAPKRAPRRRRRTAKK